MNTEIINGIAITHLKPQSGGGTGSYSGLTNKPQINGTTLEGNKTGRDLGLEHPYISLERLRKYLYRVTFDTLPEDNG
ncbi:MAG: hypothetical protein KBS67_05555, partial [Bacteroidales bacterium]|nr:hypothetical protein [Candidatus Cryptobacteroides equifaecalis]